MLRPYLVLSDHLGSTSTTANADGTLHSVIQYTAFGEIRSTQGNTPTQYRYTGQLAQAELGLDYYVARFYDPLTGHFTQADTLIPEPGKASAFDRYAYVLYNPIRYSDPSGHKDSGECAPGDICKRKKKSLPPVDDNTSNTTSTETPTVTPTPTTIPFKFSISTLQKTLTSGTPQASQKYLNAGPTVTPIVSPTVTPTLIYPQNQNPSQGGNKTKVSVNWDNVDVADAAIDVVGLLGDIAINKPPEGSVGWVITEVIEGASLGKTAYDLYKGDPTNATLYTLESQVKYMLLLARAERLVPRVGWIGNLVSLGINVLPNTKIE